MPVLLLYIRSMKFTQSFDVIKQKAVPILVLLLVILAGVAVYFYMQVSTLKQNPDALAQKEAETLVGIVGKLILLPDGETPTIATVSDPTKLAGQAFFAKAKVGDKVLLYARAQKAYLYDPVANKLLEVAPINATGAGNVQIEPAAAAAENAAKQEAAITPNR